ncbi:MAG TPA: sialidase family protein [Thermoanaerobaculia bacterium]|nr:sialidase family protein [Thermoanaerobaculia bacterium]
MSLPLSTAARAALALLIVSAALQAPVHAQDPVTESSPIFERAPFPECHASTLVERPDGALLAAWFGGTEEGHPDVDIWLSSQAADTGGWSPPRRVATGETGETRHPTWNPVLFQPTGGGDRPAPLLLFYKVGPSPSTWWGMLKRSSDGGQTWSEPERLPDGILGPIRSKPVELPGGVLLCGSSTEHDGWRIHFEKTADLGRTWRRIDLIEHARPDGGEYGAIQPTILRRLDGSLLALERSRQNRILATVSTDSGESWSPLEETALPNPSAGVDGLTLEDERLLLVYNHTTRGPGSRARLNVAVSEDGESWFAVAELENESALGPRAGEYSYPAVIQTRDGRVHVTYTWRRQRIQHVVLDPELFAPVAIEGGVWPESMRAPSDAPR